MNIAIGIFMTFVAVAVLGVAAYYAELYFWYVTPPLYLGLWYWNRRR